jgi:hypothetical protein
MENKKSKEWKQGREAFLALKRLEKLYGKGIKVEWVIMPLGRLMAVARDPKTGAYLGSSEPI